MNADGRPFEIDLKNVDVPGAGIYNDALVDHPRSDTIGSHTIELLRTRREGTRRYGCTRQQNENAFHSATPLLHLST
jgi:hypothetical protein